MSKEYLTQRDAVPYSVKRNIMAENGEGEINTNPQELSTQAPDVQKMPFNKVEAARQMWEESNKGRLITADERETQRILAEMGVPPISGGADLTQKGKEIADNFRAGKAPIAKDAELEEIARQNGISEKEIASMTSNQIARRLVDIEDTEDIQAQVGDAGDGDSKEPPTTNDSIAPDPEPEEKRDDISDEALKEEFYKRALASWLAVGADPSDAEYYARAGRVAIEELSLKDNLKNVEQIMREEEDKGLSENLGKWLYNHGVVDVEIKKALDALRENFEKHDGKVSTGNLSGILAKIGDAEKKRGLNVNDPAVKAAIRNLEIMWKVRGQQEFYMRSLEEQEAMRLEEERKRARGEGENPYDPPGSLEDLIAENIKSAPLEYREGGAKALLYVILDKNGKEITEDGTETGKKVYRVNFENLNRYIHEQAMQRGATSPLSAINYFGVLRFRKGFNQYTLEDVLLNNDPPSLFLPNEEPGEDPNVYRARVDVYKSIKDTLGSDLYIRMNDRQKHMALEYSGSLGSDEDYEKVLLKEFLDNAQVRGNDFELRLNLSSALSYSPERIDERIRLKMALFDSSSDEQRREIITAKIQKLKDGDTRKGEWGAILSSVGDEGKEKRKKLIEELLEQQDDNFDGQIFRQGMSVYAHSNDFDALVEVLGKDSSFFRRDLNGLPEAARKYMLEDKLSFLHKEKFNDKWFNDDGSLKFNTELEGISTKAAFIEVMNIFNNAKKENPTIEGVQERIVIALAEKAYTKLAEEYREQIRERVSKNIAENEDNRDIKIKEAIEDQLWKDAFESARYNHEDSYYWTSIGGLNTGDNDPTAQAFRAKSKIDNIHAYVRKQLSKNRGQIPGNFRLAAGVTRVSTSMVNSIRTLNGRSILDVVEGRNAHGGTMEFNFDNKVKDVLFEQSAMSFLADNHYRRIFKWFRNVIDSKELSIDSFIKIDTSPYGDGRLIIDKKGSQDFLSALKDWRYVFNQLPMDQKVRVIVGQRENGEYIYEEKILAEALFTKELLHDYIAKEDRIGEDGKIEVKKGEVDPSKVNDGYIWKAFAKYFIMTEVLEHRDKKSLSNYYDSNQLFQIFRFLENIPAEVDWGNPKENINDRSVKNVEVTAHFFSPEEMKWIKQFANASDLKVALEELRRKGGAGLIEGFAKLFLTATGADQLFK